MKRVFCQLGMVVIAAAAVGATSKHVPPLLPHRPVSFAESFHTLLERNIFDENRTRDAGSVTHSHIESVREQTTFTLTGLVYEDGAYSAFIEDGRTNTTSKYRIGDMTPGGKITRAGMDSITIISDGRTIHVGLGEDLSGMAPVASTNPTTEPTGPEGSIIERLRQRRLQELRQ